MYIYTATTQCTWGSLWNLGTERKSLAIWTPMVREHWCSVR